jgi:SAM-dependent methyltransferase
VAPAEIGGNIDPKVVEGFGREWAAYDQIDLDEGEFEHRFQTYFGIFPFDELPANAEGFDLGCGSGRWAVGVLADPRVGTLHCIDPSPEALAVARKRLENHPNARFHVAGADSIPLADESQDFGYSVGVLHHIPDTEAGMRDCVRKLKPGAPFLTYLYYNFDNKPGWFTAVWKVSDVLRRAICRLPFPLRKVTSNVVAASVYWPLTRVALLAERAGFDVHAFPLSPYRHYTFYTMRTDALDRFGTRLEHRFSRSQIEEMMRRCGLTDIAFSEEVPFWTACGRKDVSQGPEPAG